MPLVRKGREALTPVVPPSCFRFGSGAQLPPTSRAGKLELRCKGRTLLLIRPVSGASQQAPGWFPAGWTLSALAAGGALSLKGVWAVLSPSWPEAAGSQLLSAGLWKILHPGLAGVKLNQPGLAAPGTWQPVPRPGGRRSRGPGRPGCQPCRGPRPARRSCAGSP